MIENVLIWSLLCILLIAVVLNARKGKRLAKGQRRILRKLEELRVERDVHAINEFRQQAAFFQLHAFLAPVYPLPPMRDWAISPDFALLLVRLIHERKPARIVEFGSGSSTLICSYCLQRLGAGEVISIDHDAGFAQKTRDDLRMHGLSDWEDVRVAELEASQYLDDAQQPIDWYAADVVANVPDGVDLVIVDGPPAKNKSLARYPALPAIRDRLSAGATLLLDDADRREEREVLARWYREIPALRVTQEFTEKGASVVALRS